MSNNSFFQIAKAVGKTHFLDAYDDTIKISLLLVAPFGATDAMNDLYPAEEELTALYKSWEDVVSRKIYSWKGIPDERVSATLHKYLESEQDEEVIDTIRRAQSKIRSMLSPADILDMTPSPIAESVGDLNICTPSIVAQLVDNVLTALENMLGTFPSNYANKDSSKSLFAYDADIWNIFHIQVPLRNFQPHETIGNGDVANKIFRENGLRHLQNALTITLGDNSRVNVSTEQYYALLELYGNSEEVINIITRHTSALESVSLKLDDGSIQIPRSVVQELRSGGIGHSFLNQLVDADGDGENVSNDTDIKSFLRLIIHPTTSYVQQLKYLIAFSRQLPMSERLQQRIQLAEAGIKYVKDAIRMKSKAKMAVEMGDSERAIAFISAALSCTADQADTDDEAQQELNRAAKKAMKSKSGNTKRNGKKQGKGGQAAFQNMFDMFADGVFDQFGGEDDENEEDDDDEDQVAEEDEFLGDQDGDDPMEFMFGRRFNDNDDEDDEDEEDMQDDDHENEDDEIDRFKEFDEDLEGAVDEDFYDELNPAHKSIFSPLNEEHEEHEDNDKDLEDEIEAEIKAGHDEAHHCGEDDMAQIREIEERIHRLKLQSFSGKKTSQSDDVSVPDGRPSDIGAKSASKSAKGTAPAPTDVANNGILRNGNSATVAATQDEANVDDIWVSVDAGLTEASPSSAINLDSAEGSLPEPYMAESKTSTSSEGVGVTESPIIEATFDQILELWGLRSDQLLPVQLKVELYFTRARYHIESGHLDEALDDCKSALSLDARHAPTYALRASITASLLAQEDMQLVEDNRDVEAAAVKHDMLREAARDALAAFLLSGCSDLEMAGAAEDAAREACRSDAKNAFSSRGKIDGSEITASTQGTIPIDQSQYLPKAWLLQSFFNGYELLSDAFSVDWDVTFNLDAAECAELQSIFTSGFTAEVKKSGYSEINFDYLFGQDPQDHLVDIDEIDSAGSLLSSLNASSTTPINLKLPIPPKHLRDVNLHAPQAGVDMSAECAADSTIPVPDTVVHAYDPEAYVLLCKLVSILDHATDDDVKDMSSLFDIEAEQYSPILEDTETDRFEEINPIMVDFPIAAVSSDDLLEFSGDRFDFSSSDSNNLLAQGCLEYFDDSSIALDIDAEVIDGNKHRHFSSKDDPDAEKARSDRIRLAAKQAKAMKSLILESDELIQQGRNFNCSVGARDSIPRGAGTGIVAVGDVDRASHSTICPPSKSFIEVLGLLRTSIGQLVTGVNFSETGFVLSCDEVAAMPNNDAGDDDGEWEDCDDDEEGSVDEEDDEVDSSKEIDQNSTDGLESLISLRNVSYALQARLLSVCSSIAYLAGDSVGAVNCLRQSLVASRNAAALVARVAAATDSVSENETAAKLYADSREANTAIMVDTLVKLASLLTDMDEVKESKSLFLEAEALNQQNAFTYLHRAELEIHDNNFSEAIAILRKAKRLTVYGSRSSTTFAESRAASLHRSALAHHQAQGLSYTQKKSVAAANQRSIQLHAERTQRSQNQLQASIYSLLGVAIFRQNPTRPDLALLELQEGVSAFPRNLYLQMCLGEVYSQGGDAVGAMKAFQEASKLDVQHPLPYVNAARTYQQLNQARQAKLHITRAIALDPALAMTRVDLSQQYLHSGNSALALETLSEALRLARHVSEIRDVLTAQNVALMQLELEQEGLYTPQLTLMEV